MSQCPHSVSCAGRGVIDKAVAIVFLIAAFVAAGFEHSVANNLVGGSVLVGLVCHLIYRRGVSLQIRVD